MPRRIPRAASVTALCIAFLPLLHCGGATIAEVENDGGGADGSSVHPHPNPPVPQPPVAYDPDATTPPLCTGSSSLPGDRPAPIACPASSLPGYYADAGSVSCKTVADCADAGVPYGGCLEGVCTVDQCFTDGDCPSGQACGCASEQRGNAVHHNQCFPAQCRVNSDCGAGGICSPTRGDFCGDLTGYQCRSAADTCTTDADCCADPSLTQCEYQPTLGHFACQAQTVCNG